MLTSVIHQEAPHHRGRDAEELGPVLPDDPPLAGEPEIGFVDQSRGPQGVIRPLPGQIPGSLVT